MMLYVQILKLKDFIMTLLKFVSRIYQYLKSKIPKYNSQPQNFMFNSTMG